jgi:WD40 repeat protein/serine/threonine protein kinase
VSRVNTIKAELGKIYFEKHRMILTNSRYHILAHLATGGMGEVFKAEDLKLQRTVALKVLRNTPSNGHSNTKQLLQEARAVASLNHPGIATLYEVDESEDEPFLIMEYVEGETLAEHLRSGQLPIDQSIDIALQIAEALQWSHSHGVLHGDLTSSNIILTSRGVVKVLDFGLARLKKASSDQHSAPQETDTAGTLAYLAPEQALGSASTERTDIFSLGVLFYEMLAGRRPFVGSTPSETIQEILNEQPPRLSNFRDDIPLQLEAILRKAVAKNPGDRYPNTSEFVVDLQRLRRDLAIPASVGQVSNSASAPDPSVDPELSMDRRPSGQNQFSEVIRNNLTSKRWFIAAVVLAAAGFLLEKILGWAGAVLVLLAAIAGFLVYTVRIKQKPRLRASDPHAIAFRGLLPFHEADRDRFYGRESDTSLLLQKVASPDFRFGVLYGESGCGKTSLLRAGLLPRLREMGFLALYCRSHSDLSAVIVAECKKQSLIEFRAEQSLQEYLAAVCRELNATILIVCDQFEEFFVSFRSSPEREPFLSFVSNCFHQDNLPVRFLLSLRSDFLHFINSDFGDRVEEPLLSSRLYHLRQFDEANSGDIIERSAQQAGICLEPGLSRQVARDLAVSGTVLPSELQIVGEQLQNKRVFSLQAYRRQGGKAALVHQFLEDAIQSSGNSEIAKLLLRGLISDENTRLTLPLAEIVRRTQRPSSTVKVILDHFVQSRLVGCLQDDEPWRYELMHEYLIEKINQLTGRVMDATQRANRILRQYLSQAAVEPRTCIPMSQLWFISRHSDIRRSELGQALWKLSLWWGLAKAGLMFILLTVGTLLLAGAMGTTEEWEARKFTDGHDGTIRQAVFSPNGNRLVSVGEDSKILVWDLAGRTVIRTLVPDGRAVHTVAFSPDGRQFATGGAGKNVTLWDAASLEKQAVLSGHSGSVNSVAYSNDGRLLASSGDDNRTVLWNLDQFTKRYEWPFGGVWGNILFVPGNLLLNSSGIGWDVRTGREVLDFVSKTEGAANFEALSPDGKQMVRVGGGGTVVFWDLRREKSLSTTHPHQDHAWTVAYSPDGRWVATGADDIILWEAAARRKLLRLEQTSTVRGLAFSPDSRWLVSSHDDGSTLIWDALEHDKVGNLQGHSKSVNAVALSRSGAWLASGSDDRSVIVWNTTTRAKKAVFVGHDTRVTAVAFAPDESWLGSCDLAGTCLFWDVRTGRLLRRFKNASATNCLGISPDGRWAASDHRVIETATGREVIDFNSGEVQILFYGASFSADGRWLAVAAPDTGEVLIYKTTDWTQVDVVKTRDTNELPRVVSFSPDSDKLVTGDNQGAVWLWKREPLHREALLGRHVGQIKSVAFSPDGRQVLSAGDDHTISLWDVRRRRLVTHIGSHASPVNAVAFSQDGKQFVSGEGDNSVRVYTRHRVLWGRRLDQ